MPPVFEKDQAVPCPDAERRARAERRADFLVRMLQGNMALEGQGLPDSTLSQLRRQVVELLLARDE